ncbi:hypothetical protein BDN70DRAFT_884489 [Pholiota conissans]|uniref:Uncharacterized protein n=1 Tax=Pholiota conissans TaxID=109636 RepID=A0A9P5YVQ7_9AGAR|nr:hypothetical protein BDN70DRAFT_884489 [Pholiota conissans]
MHWTASGLAQAKEWINEATLIHQTSIRISKKDIAAPEVVSVRKFGIPSRVVVSQRVGMSNMKELGVHLSSDSSFNSLDDSESDSEALSQPSTQQQDLHGDELIKEDKAAAQVEFQKWTSSGIITDPHELDNLDLVQLWQVKSLNVFILFLIIILDSFYISYSTIAKIFLFSIGLPLTCYLYKLPPCPASTLSPPARKKTRSGLGEDMTEVLQVYKYIVWGSRLDFTQGLLASKEGCSVLDIPPSTLTNMFLSGIIEGLQDLIDS